MLASPPEKTLRSTPPAPPSLSMASRGARLRCAVRGIIAELNFISGHNPDESSTGRGPPVRGHDE